jgi:hypothetical protein
VNWKCSQYQTKFKCKTRAMTYIERPYMAKLSSSDHTHDVDAHKNMTDGRRFSKPDEILYKIPKKENPVDVLNLQNLSFKQETQLN